MRSKLAARSRGRTTALSPWWMSIFAMRSTVARDTVTTRSSGLPWPVGSTARCGVREQSSAKALSEGLGLLTMGAVGAGLALVVAEPAQAAPFTFTHAVNASFANYYAG